jgi:prepilin-type N-terminal cleavage/methylation domain-containing protein
VKRSPRARAGQRGFTLLELLVTLTVTTIGLVGLLSLHVSLTRGNEITSRTQEGSTIANQTLENLRSQRPADMMTTLTGNPATVPPVTVTIGTAAGRNGLTYSRTVIVTAVTSTLWKLRVTVSWTDDGAVAGGKFDHAISAEIVRTTQETL